MSASDSWFETTRLGSVNGVVARFSMRKCQSGLMTAMNFPIQRNRRPVTRRPGSEFCVSSRETAYKVKHLERDPRVWLTCLTKQFYGEWLSIKGTATVVHLPDAMDGLIDYYRGISGEHPDWDDYRAAMVRDQRCLIRLSATRAGPDREG